MDEIKTLCVNAFAGMSRWYCYDFGGKRTPGKETLIGGKCSICILSETDGELPSFMRNEDDE